MYIKIKNSNLFIQRFSFNKTSEDRPAIIFLHDSFGCVELWRDFPDYYLGDMNVKGIIKKTAIFTKRLQAIGISTRITDDLSLLVEALGLDADELLKESGTYLSSGNAESLEKMIKRVHKDIEAGLDV